MQSRWRKRRGGSGKHGKTRQESLQMATKTYVLTINKAIHIAIVRFGFLVSHGYSLRSR